MKVTPAAKKERGKDPSKIHQYLQCALGWLVVCVGLSPFKMDMETWEFSFRWISSETFWSLVRLVLFNSPFSFLPIILCGVYGPKEWETDDLGISNFTNGSMSVSTAVFAVEYVSSYTYFILYRTAKIKRMVKF